MKSGDVLEVAGGRFEDEFDMRLEREGLVQNDTQVADFWGDGVAVYIEDPLEQQLGSHYH